MTKATKPIAVLISDIHFTPATLELASSALRQALDKSIELDIPLIIAGDTLDSKSIIRGECANRLIDIFTEKGTFGHNVYILVGNHDLLNEKGNEHSLNFLSPYINVVQSPVYLNGRGNILLIPYSNDTDKLQAVLDYTPTGSTLIMHQGVQTAYMGHYVQDKTSLPKEAFADFRVISGHYHRNQDIKCGRPRKGAVGLFTYIGTPYTTSFAEAEDGPKGFQVFLDNGLLEFVPTNLRKHMIVERTPETILDPVENYNPGDLVWLKVKGPYSELEKLSKCKIGEKLFGHSNFKFDKIYSSEEGQKGVKSKRLTGEELMDKLIDDTSEAVGIKASLKKLWREVI